MPENKQHRQRSAWEVPSCTDVATMLPMKCAHEAYKPIELYYSKFFGEAGRQTYDNGKDIRAPQVEALSACMACSVWYVAAAADTA
eukprot:scaffold184466_cov17-Prasinocladus_malaysianus.AAC.1